MVHRGNAGLRPLGRAGSRCRTRLGLIATFGHVARIYPMVAIAFLSRKFRTLVQALPERHMCLGECYPRVYTS